MTTYDDNMTKLKVSRGKFLTEYESANTGFTHVDITVMWPHYSRIGKRQCSLAMPEFWTNFLPDPGVSVFRSMGPGVCTSKSFGRDLVDCPTQL